MSTSVELGDERAVQVAGATLHYRERGEGRPLVFVHGLLTNGDLWRKVVPSLAAAGYRCITPDWPFGAHTTAVPGVDLTPPGVADLMAGFLAALDLSDAVVVANDTGGGMTQVLMARHPERIGAVVLTPSDTLDRFPPPPLVPLPWLARLPGGTWTMVQNLRLRALHYLPFTFGWTVKRRMPRELLDSYLAPSRGDRQIRADLKRFVAGMRKKHTRAAGEQLAGFRPPVLLAWATEDRLFPIRYAHKLRDILPDATLVEIEDSYTFVPEDQPDLLADAIASFLGAKTRR